MSEHKFYRRKFVIVLKYITMFSISGFIYMA